MDLHYKTRLAACLVLLTITAPSCEKFLDAKQDKRIVIPETLVDLQALLDAAMHINYGYFPGLLELGTDDYYVTYATLNNSSEFERDNYLWTDEPFYQNSDKNVSWMFPYKAILIMNTVLDELPNVTEDNEKRKNEIQGSALFFRGFSFFHLAQVFCETYDIDGNNHAPGIPLRLTPDFNQPSKRHTVEETYNRILMDLLESVELLPGVSEYPTRPTKVAALAALARVYLVMGDIENALAYADRAIGINPVLMDYNEVNPDLPIPFSRFNEETLFYAYSSGFRILNPSNANVDPQLYESYHDNDLRKQLFFRHKGDNEYGFRGSYAGTTNNSFFVGLTTSELYLIRAECYSRLNQPEKAMEALNHLMEYRWKQGSFVPYVAADANDALDIIIGERRKELLMRGIRWSDLKRLNKNPRFAKTLTRTVDDGENSETYTLPANDPRYNFMIPQEVIVKTGIRQNERNK